MTRKARKAVEAAIRSFAQGFLGALGGSAAAGLVYLAHRLWMAAP